MLPVTAQVAAILSSAFRAPRAYLAVQIPLISNAATNTFDFQKLGSMRIFDNILSLRRQSVLEQGSDIMNVELSNQDGALSPLNAGKPMARYFYPGAIDNKYQLFMGVTLNGAETIFPKGVFLSESSPQALSSNGLTLTLNALDQFSQFKGNVYTQFPPRLYGNQSSAYYNPGYALTNPTGDLKTYVCDAVNWMQTSTQSALWSSDYVPVAVYVSTSAGGATAVNPSTYTVDYVNGKITFNTVQTSTAVVSVDARPLAMAPEAALKRLFVDYGSFDPNFLKFDNTGILFPIMENARDRAIIDVAREIVDATAPRGLQWVLFFDENGFLNFTESNVEAPPVKTLYDTRDIIDLKPEFTARDIRNVVRAQSRASNDQPVVSVSYDVYSISTFGQRPTYDIAPQLLSTVGGLDPGAAMQYMNNLTASQLFVYSTPTIQTEVTVVPDPAVQVGDPVWIYDTHTGLNRQFIIKQISDDIRGADWKQVYRVEESKGTQDFQYGLQFYTGAPTPQNQNVIQAANGLIQQVSFNGTNVVANGSPSLGPDLLPINYQWNGGSLNIQITMTQTNPAANCYLWRWMYMTEDAYDIGGKMTGTRGGYTLNFPTRDNANNKDTIAARRAFWPLLRPSDWAVNDGVTAYATGSGPVVVNSTWSGGVGASGSYFYGNLRSGITDYFSNITAGFVGQPIWGAGTPAATALGSSSTVKLGCDFGTSFGGPVFYGIKRKVTPAYLVILAANTLGMVQYKKIPFSLAI